MKKMIFATLMFLSASASAATLTGQISQGNGTYLCTYSDGSVLILPVCPAVK